MWRFVGIPQTSETAILCCCNLSHTGSANLFHRTEYTIFHFGTKQMTTSRIILGCLLFIWTFLFIWVSAALFNRLCGENWETERQEKVCMCVNNGGKWKVLILNSFIVCNCRITTKHNITDSFCLLSLITHIRTGVCVWESVTHTHVCIQLYISELYVYTHQVVKTVDMQLYTVNICTTHSTHRFKQHYSLYTTLSYMWKQLHVSTILG